jgi:hypothetical protein
LGGCGRLIGTPMGTADPEKIEVLRLGVGRSG